MKAKSAEVLALSLDGLLLSPCTGYSGSTILNCMIGIALPRSSKKRMGAGE